MRVRPQLRPLHDESGLEGSIAIAMTVTLILTSLSLAVLARTLAAIASARHHQDFSAALADADAGLSDALFRLDQQGPTTSSIGSTTAPVTGTVASGSYAYVVTKVDDFTFRVRSKGIVNGRPHAIEASVVRKPRYEFAIFGNNGVTFNGNGAGNIYAYTTGVGRDSGRKANIGSNRAIVVRSGQGAGDEQVYYSDQGSCSGCPNPVPARGPQVVAEPLIPSSPVPGGCPGTNGNIAGGTVLMSGTYVCDRDVTFNGIVTAGGAVKIYMTNAPGTNTTLRLSGSTVNKGGDPVNLQIFKIGGGTIEPGNGSNTTDFTGIIDAPSSDLTVNGGQMTFQGALVTNTFRVNGSPNLEFKYDQRILALVGEDWRVKDYTEIASGSVGF